MWLSSWNSERFCAQNSAWCNVFKRRHDLIWSERPIARTLAALFCTIAEDDIPAADLIISNCYFIAIYVDILKSGFARYQIFKYFLLW